MCVLAFLFLRILTSKLNNYFIDLFFRLLIGTLKCGHFSPLCQPLILKKLWINLKWWFDTALYDW